MPNLDELLGPGESLTLDAVLALPDSNNKYPNGHLASNYRSVFYGSYMARPFRLQRAVLTPNGTRYENVTQTLDGRPISEARCLVWETKRRVEAAEFGWITRRDTMFSVLPEDVKMFPGWRVSLFDVPEPANTRINRAGSSNALPGAPVKSVLAIYTEAGALVSASTYSVSEEGISWLSGAPAEGASLSVDYEACPWYEWLPDEQSILQRGADDSLLPQIGRIQKVSSQ